MAGLSNILFGRRGSVSQLPLYTPQQQSMMSQLGSQALAGLQGNQFDFAPIEAQARRGFSQQTIPGIAERFTGMGGGQRSSAFAGALGGAGADLDTNLAALKSQYGLQQQNQLMNMLQLALRPQFENTYRPSTQGLFGGILGGASQGIGSSLSSLLPLLLGL